MNQPTVPQIITSIETAKNRDARRPAVVPPKTLTRAKITIVVNEPIMTGNSIVKSYRLWPIPNDW